MATIIIPARMGSTRLPNKPMALIRGKQMIKRVYDQCIKAKVGPVYVASDDQIVFDACHDCFETIGIMTSRNCISGTDRVAQAANILELDQDEIVLNVQGDMPFIPFKLISQFSEFMQGKDMGTVAIPLIEPISHGLVSVTLNKKNQAMYFSRSNIPNGDGASVYYRHVGMYGYKVSILREIAKHGKSMLEQAESLEQLRVIENDICKIDVMLSQIDPGGEVNTFADLQDINRP